MFLQNKTFQLNLGLSCEELTSLILHSTEWQCLIPLLSHQWEKRIREGPTQLLIPLLKEHPCNFWRCCCWWWWWRWRGISSIRPNLAADKTDERFREGPEIIWSQRKGQYSSESSWPQHWEFFFECLNATVSPKLLFIFCITDYNCIYCRIRQIVFVNWKIFGQSKNGLAFYLGPVL